jgi:hypothetical protein
MTYQVEFLLVVIDLVNLLVLEIIGTAAVQTFDYFDICFDARNTFGFHGRLS